jgi:hypothetical protein
MFSCFGVQKKGLETTPIPSSSQAIAERTKSMSERTKSMSLDMARSTGTVEDDDEFQLRLQGYDVNDPEFKALREEKMKRRSQDMESKRMSQEQLLHNRLQGL